MAKLSSTSSAAPTTTKQRKSYLLSVTPVEYSLTEGTDIPAPEKSPPRSPALAPPPTPGRGPLNSHPTTPDNVSDMAVDPPAMATQAQQQEQEMNGHQDAERVRSRANTNGAATDAESFKTPTSPASAAQNSSSSPQQTRRPSGVRKLLSLSNLRSSFSSSRTSLAIPRSSNDTYSTQQQYSSASSTYGGYNPSLKRPGSPGMMSTTASSIGWQSQNGDSHDPQQRPQPRLRTKKSGGNWFKRKSGLFMLNGQNGDLESVAEDQTYSRPETGGSSKRQKSSAGGGAETVVNRVPPSRERERSPPPTIPEIGRGSFSGGDLGWDEGVFGR